MKVKTITVPFDQEREQFADEELETFLAGKHVLAMQEHFFQSGGRPCITFIIRYLDEKPAGHLTVGSRHASTENSATRGQFKGRHRGLPLRNYADPPTVETNPRNP